MEDSANSLAHCQWNCKYHIVFAPKYRRKTIYDKIKVDIGQILRKLCKWKGVEIIEAELCPDHVHMLVKIPPKYSVSTFIGFLFLGQYCLNRRSMYLVGGSDETHIDDCRCR